jgi:predicted nucleotidyltransferase
MGGSAEPILIADATCSSPHDALSRFARSVRTAYGRRLHGLHLFGSRARGCARPDSDFDIVVVLTDDSLDFWVEKLRLVDIAYETLLETGQSMQAWPCARSEWENGRSGQMEALLEEARRDSVEVPS